MAYRNILGRQNFGWSLRCHYRQNNKSGYNFPLLSVVIKTKMPALTVCTLFLHIFGATHSKASIINIYC